MTEPRPFEVAWSPRELAVLRQRIRDYRFPLQPAESGWQHGCDPRFLKRFCTHWTERYDVDAAQRELNRYPQRIADVAPGTSLHFAHVTGARSKARPLLLAHGWPGSYYQFWPMVESLRDHFDLVIPSLPGYGFSSKPITPIGARTVAKHYTTLMRDVLGYDDYLVAGTDWGSAVAPWMALDHADGLHGIYIDMPIVRPSARPSTDEEIAYQKSAREHEQRLGAYAHLQGTRVQSLAYAMVDSPVAQAAWILERFHDWADLGDRTVEDVFGLDRLVTSVMMYAMTGTFTTATWLYTGSIDDKKMPEDRRVTVPTGYVSLNDPRHPRAPRSFVEKGYDVMHWSEQPRGGHFASMEIPDALSADIRAWADRIDLR